MTIGYGGAGAAGTGTTSATPTFPASSGAGDLLLLLTGHKPYSSVATSATFTGLGAGVASGTTSSGNGTGSTVAQSFTRLPTGSLSGSETVSVASGTPTMAQILRWTKGAAETWGTVVHQIRDRAPLGTSIQARDYVVDRYPWPNYTLSGTTYPTGLAYGDGYWVVVGQSGLVRYTTDPAGGSGAWTSNPQGSTMFNAVAYGNGYWVAVGQNGTLYYRASDPAGAWTSNPQGSTTFNAVAYGNGYWVAVGDSGTLYYRASDPAGAWTSNPQGSTTLTGVTYGDGYFFATSSTNNASVYQTGTPGGTWATATTSGAGYNTVGYHFGAFVHAAQWAPTPADEWWSTLFGIGTLTGVASDGAGTMVACGSVGGITYHVVQPPDIKQGDAVVVSATIGDDAPTHTSQSLTIPGCTLSAMTWLTKVSTTSGGDGAMYIGYCTVDSGAATGLPVYAATISVSGKAETACQVVGIRAQVPPASLPRRPAATRLIPNLVR